MVAISMELGNGFLEKCEKLKGQIPKAYDRAVKEALKKGKSAFEDTKGGAPSVYNIKKKDLSQFVSLVNDGIRVKSRRLTVGTDTHFSITPKAYSSQNGIPVSRRRKMSAKIKKQGAKAFPHGFIANPSKVRGGHTMLWERSGTQIAPVKTISAAQMASSEEVHPYVEEQMTEKLQERFRHHFDRIKI